ncbi:MAG: hypothetical protein HN356_01720 [Calditrichaeota bacterium]|jgi:hypothetical protein|nr:hypothetical protein [Calditrichota bacterium]MBT7618398.1 hypothetical protein [Calditrichota bacterium]MBT7788093.1 hypothetical protein [Calditrichota bacterium]
MSINKTFNYLLTQKQETIICFSAQVTTGSTYMKGPGGEAGDGFPMPRKARVYRVDCWDGSTLKSKSDNVVFNQGERLSVYVTDTGLNYDVAVRNNGVVTALVASGTNQNCTLWVTVHLRLV